MNIYSCIDNTNIDKIIVLFNSCYINCSNKESLKFYLLIDKRLAVILENQIIPSNIKDILQIGYLDMDFLEKNGWLDLHNEFSKYFYKQSKCNHIMNFARFFIFDHFPDLEEAIYLDWDMIVQDDITNLDEYYNECKNNNKLIVAESDKFCTLSKNILNYNELIYKRLLNDSKNINNKIDLDKINYRYKLIWNKLINKYENLLNVKMDSKSFNAGFCIINKNILDHKKLKELILLLIKIQKEESCFRFGTQVILNLLSIDNIIFIDKKWNNIDESSSIIHWSGPDKPWNTNNSIWNKYKNY